MASIAPTTAPLSASVAALTRTSPTTSFALLTTLPPLPEDLDEDRPPDAFPDDAFLPPALLLADPPPLLPEDAFFCEPVFFAAVEEEADLPADFFAVEEDADAGLAADFFESADFADAEDADFFVPDAFAADEEADEDEADFFAGDLADGVAAAAAFFVEDLAAPPAAPADFALDFAAALPADDALPPLPPLDAADFFAGAFSAAAAFFAGAAFFAPAVSVDFFAGIVFSFCFRNRNYSAQNLTRFTHKKSRHFSIIGGIGEK